MTKQCFQPGTRHGEEARPSALMDLGDLVKPWLCQKNKARLQVAVVTGPSLLLTPGFPQLSHHLFLEQEEHVVLPEPDAGLQPSSWFLRLPGEWRQ